MASYVWASNPSAYLLLRGLNSDIFERDPETYLEAKRRNDCGLPVPPQMCPKRMWIDETSEAETGFKALPFPELFRSGTYWMMSRRAADIFRKYDLGEGALYPVEEGIYLADNVTPTGQEFVCWIRGNTKDSFMQDSSVRVKPRTLDRRLWKTASTLQDDDLALSDLALSGPAVWMEQRLFHCVFLAGDLGDQLIKAGLKTAFALQRCRVIADKL
jgi:hypothetical protein